MGADCFLIGVVIKNCGKLLQAKATLLLQIGAELLQVGAVMTN